MTAPAALEAEGLGVAYGDFVALQDVGLDVRGGEIVCVLGANGSGKSTLLKAIAGLVPLRAGTRRFLGQPVDDVPCHELARRGLCLVPERRRLFQHMTVWENLDLGARTAEARASRAETLEWIEGLFPLVRERRAQRCASLSGGEQQIATIARGLMGRPRLLILDEPFLGLSPLMVRTIVEVLRRINAEGCPFSSSSRTCARAWPCLTGVTSSRRAGSPRAVRRTRCSRAT